MTHSQRLFAHVWGLPCRLNPVPQIFSLRCSGGGPNQEVGCGSGGVALAGGKVTLHEAEVR